MTLDEAWAPQFVRGALVAEYLCDERTVSPVDEAGGVARRWSVVHRASCAMRTVVMLRPDGGRWMAQPSLRCECAIPGCRHVAAVLAEIVRTTPPAAA
jgi:hypothetical protein